MHSFNKSNKLKLIIFTLVLITVCWQAFSLTAAAAGETDFCVAVDYYSEKLRILNPNSLLTRYGSFAYMEIYDNGSVISGASSGIGKSDLAKSISIAYDGEYMYSLKAFSEEELDALAQKGKNQKRIAILRKERWFPIYGGGIDLSAIIPERVYKNSKKQYYIAIRRADDIFDTNTGYASRAAVLIKPRFSDRDLNKFIEYDAVNEKIILSRDYAGGSSMEIIYKFDYFGDISGTLTKNALDLNVNIDVSGKLYPLGGAVYIYTMPVIKEGAYGPEVVFARSKEIKIKIPKIPSMPSIRADITAKKLASIKKDTLEWSLAGGSSPDSWQAYKKTETSLPFSEVLNTFPGLGENNKDENGNYIIYFRTKAALNKSPASLPKKITIPAGLCG